MRKPFDVQLFKENDERARSLLKKAFKDNYNYRCEDNEDVYGPDLKVWNPNGFFIGYAEVEIKQFWKNKDFPSLTMHIPERKRKFLKHNDIVFCVLSADGTQGCWVEGDDLATCAIINKPNKYMENEKFFEIPISMANFFKIQID